LRAIVRGSGDGGDRHGDLLLTVRYEERIATIRC
jgi:hypothetical protein